MMNRPWGDQQVVIMSRLWRTQQVVSGSWVINRSWSDQQLVSELWSAQYRWRVGHEGLGRLCCLLSL